MFIVALFAIDKIWKQPKCPSTDEWVKNIWHIYIYIYNAILLTRKRMKVLSFEATWLDLEGIMRSEISQTEKDKYCMISLVFKI